jgi:hypothetical protein
MPLQRIKMIVSCSWVLLTLTIAIAVQVSGPLQIAAAALCLLPPLALLLWWNEPAPTMAESIDAARRQR